MDPERTLARAFLEAHPVEAASILEGLGAEESAALLAEVPPQSAAALLQRMTSLGGGDCLARMSPERAGAVLAILPLDAAAALLRRLEPGTAEALLALAPQEIGAPLRLLLRYPENTAGALMDPRVLAVPHALTAAEALARVRRTPRHAFSYLYVVDHAQSLVGVLTLRELLLAPPKGSVASAMQPCVARLNVRADRGIIVTHPGWRQFHALPVVDDGDAFLGAVRYQTLRRLQDDAAGTPPAYRALDTVLTLGELCWVGLAGFMADLASTLAPSKPQDAAGGEEADHGA